MCIICNQLNVESVEQYIMKLYKLVETCNYGETKSKMICDRLVVASRIVLYESKQQIDPDLIPKKKICQYEAVHEQQ